MINITSLNKKNFMDQIVRHGYFAEQIPSCFTSNSLADNLSNVLVHISCTQSQSKKSNKNATAPTTLSTYKNDISRRVLSLPNPEAFLRIAKLISENWTDVQDFAESPNSLSPITFINQYNPDRYEMLNSENLRDDIHARSDFIKGIKECIMVSLGYKYRLKVDIANCYNSIYTHSISWAICGKNEAKKYFRTKEPQSLKQKYDLSELLDTFTRYQKNNETNGIVVGPFTSRIFSEIIFAELDRKLTERKFQFRRFVDDYKFYFRTEAQATESLPIIEKILNEYNLNLNTAKTEVDKYPYEIISTLKDCLATALKNEGVFGVLNTASQFYLNGEKGSYKYALKLIKDCEIPIKKFGIIMPYLINILLLDPKYGKYVVSYLKGNIKLSNCDELITIINNELRSSLKNELQQEALLFVQIIMELELCVDAQNLIDIITSNNDFAIIIALDIWKNRKDSVIRSRTEAKTINESIRALADSLVGENYSGSRWLLLYEIEMHKLLEKDQIPKVEKSLFFKEISLRGVSFYSGIK